MYLALTKSTHIRIQAGGQRSESCSVVEKNEQNRRNFLVNFRDFMGLPLHYEYFISLLSAVVALVLLFAHRERTLSPRTLALYFFCVSYMVLFYALIRYGEIIHFPHLWRTSVFIGMLNPALAFIYVRSVLEQRSRFRRSDIILLIIPVILSLTFLDFYLQPAGVKLATIQETLANKSLYLEEREGLLPSGISLMIRNFFGITMAIWQGVLLYRWFVHKRPVLPDTPQNLAIFRWLVFFTCATGITFILTTVQHFFQFFHEEDFYWITSSTVMFAVVSALVYLFLRPNILYGLHGWAKPGTLEEFPEVSTVEAKQSSRRDQFNSVQVDNIRDKVEAYVEEHKPFLRQGYTIANLSVDTGVPLYQLSAFINQQYGQSFKEFINGYRVQYIKDVLLKEHDTDRYTLEAIGKKAGFNSRSTLIAAVKKKTGQTPSSFLFGKE
jgi:AraC-like DNA-binding protein